MLRFHSRFYLLGHCAARFQSDMGQLYDLVSDPRTMIWQSSNQAFARVEVTCPQPRRVVRVPTFMEGFNKIDHKPKSILPKYKEGSTFQILDTIQNKDEDNDFYEVNQTGFFCGSPPVRSCNPVVHDAHFSKQTQSLVPTTFAVSTGKPKPSVGVDGGSPAWRSFNGSPKARIEGFACGKSDPCHVVHTLA